MMMMVTTDSIIHQTAADSDGIYDDLDQCQTAKET